MQTKNKPKIADVRKKKGYTQEQLAQKVEISRAYLSNVEQGNYGPSLKVAGKIAKALGVNVEDLFF